MKALALAEPKRMELHREWPEPKCGPRDVVLRMRGVGLCGSDLTVFDGNRALPVLPWVMGHEGCGEVVAAGSAATGPRVGETVVVEPNYCCMACAWCRSGRTAACDQRRIVGMDHPGLLAEYAAVPAEFAWPVPEEWPVERLVCVEPLAVAHGVVRRSGIAPGEECLVIGAGSQGLLVCLSLLALGARPAVAEPHQGRRELAHSLGATLAEDPRRPYGQVFETSGSETGFHTALRQAGKTATVSVVGQNSNPTSVVTQQIVQRQLTLRGALIYEHPADFQHTRDALESLDLRPERIIRATATPGDAAAAFAAAREVPGKSWIDLSEWSLSDRSPSDRT